MDKRVIGAQKLATVLVGLGFGSLSVCTGILWLLIPPSSDSEDTLNWNLNGDETYTVKSVYLFASNSNQHIEHWPRRQIWKVRKSLKVLQEPIAICFFTVLSLTNYGGSRNRNGVGILVDRELREQVVEIRRVNDMMMIKLVIGGLTLSIISAYAPEADLGEEVKKRFWEDLDEVVRANSSFSKREEHLVTFRSSMARTQIDYLLLRKADRVLFKDRKVIPSKNLTTQHKLLAMDLKIKRKRQKKALCIRPEDQIGLA
uniref:Craniofacial development protein 2-like n=2 Tax=Nicotiana TaxID=4085 RepID=A0A1S4BFW2_TOBAC|nr:PREDICTED: uncharacterized protein LOC104220505 [Nicotiana sylvestris]XP_016487774.1 PREDICTED: uncharacterized protein LOC107807850 [Nicotiana tabacum]